MSTFTASKSLFNQYHFSIVEIDLPIVEGVTDLVTSIKDAAPQWYWELNELSGLTAVDSMNNGNLAYESEANSTGYSVIASNFDGVGAAKDISGDSTLQIYDPVDIPVPSLSPFHSSDLWTGSGATRDIVTGLDQTLGGFVWIKSRSFGTRDHCVYDSVKGAGFYRKIAQTTTAYITRSNGLTSYNSDGYSLSTSSTVNSSGNYIGYSFINSTNNFSIFNWSGTSASNTIAHGLGTTPGMVIVKGASSFAWMVQHRSLAANQRVPLSYTSTPSTDTTIWDNTISDATNFYAGNSNYSNGSSTTYTGFAFGHDTSASGQVACDSYVGNGSTSGPTVVTGWQPMFIMIKNVTTTGTGWCVFDTARGINVSASDLLFDLRDSSVEISGEDHLELTTTGFTLKNDLNNRTNKNGDTYIYMAIRDVGV